ncbi:hypothetical protein ACFQ5N_06440 [Lutibacter holmesii]|uniref:Aromatic hydrocarbon degradation protein n=1 Tax=Lutibacter holmesii TaxID=1137985 RepID=A0ABW3WMK0_9FLAO
MIKKIIVVIITLLISVSGFAQINNTSVYSFFGIGDKNNSATTEQLSMGGVGVALSEVHRLNLSNPASNASLKFTSYTLGLVSKNSKVSQKDDSQIASATYLSYLAMGFNIGKKGGLSFGILPNTSVGYNLLSINSDSDGNTEDTSYFKGEGGTSRVFLGFGYSPIKGLNLGLQGDYIFGKITNSILNKVDDATLATKYETVSNVAGFKLNAGFQYTTKINEFTQVYAGGNFILGNDIESKEKEYLYTVNPLSTSIAKDTILSNTNYSNLKNPIKSTIGIGVGRDNKWYAGVDYSYQKASELEESIYETPNIKYSDYNRFSIGGFYTPKYNSILSYWNRVTYRAGFYMEDSGLKVDGDKTGENFEELGSFGISFGVGLPVGKQQISNLNLGFEYGKRGETGNNLVQEDFFNFRMSISLGDKWFQKRQIN